MAFADQPTHSVSYNRSTRSNGWLIAYAAIALIAIAASIYLASSGPGMSEADIAIAAVLP